MPVSVFQRHAGVSPPTQQGGAGHRKRNCAFCRSMGAGSSAGNAESPTAEAEPTLAVQVPQQLLLLLLAVAVLACYPTCFCVAVHLEGQGRITTRLLFPLPSLEQPLFCPCSRLQPVMPAWVKGPPCARGLLVPPCSSPQPSLLSLHGL